ncbi:hypothetical protein ACO34A_13220 [Rhizobium sp. ACO-34A]|nr:hypothetical protein [Rhizobium sp. ACO-34A]ATN34761.1 hypothetical protein ACO34A_13220 [Rhizobium sp. ACO-34A]
MSTSLIETDTIRRQVAESGRPFVAAGEVIGAMVAVMEAAGGRERAAMFLARMLEHLEGGDPPLPDHSLTDV